MITVLDGYPENVLAVSYTGQVTAADYEDILIPEVRRRIAAQGTIRFLCYCGPDFTSMTPAAMVSDTKLGHARRQDFSRLAIVSDIVWLRTAARMFAPLFHHPVRVFSNREFAAAKAWVEEPDPS